jgi:hypothetical protein
MHMSQTHGGYEDSDLAAAAGVGGSEGDVRSRMASFAETLPGGADDSPDIKRAGTAGSGSAVPPAPVPPTPERRVRATPKKLKKILGGIPAKILEETGIELDGEDRDALDEAGEFLADIFGVEFAVPESKVVVESRFFAILWVIGMTFLIYAKHRFSKILIFIKAQQGEKTEETLRDVDERNRSDAA